MTAIHRAVPAYLMLRRSLGFKLAQPGQLLPGFADYLAGAGAEHVTIELALAWATAPADAQPGWYRRRLSIVRGFAIYLHGIDPDHQVPPAGLLTGGYDRPTPYLFTTGDIAALLGATSHLRGRLHAATHYTIIALVAVTGIRPGEAIRLGRNEVDLDAAVLTITRGKYGRSRRILLHPSTIRALVSYAAIRDECCPRPSAANFFLSTVGTPLKRSNVDGVFKALAHRVGLRPRSARCRPVLMGLRHTFAVNTLIGWYRAGLDVDAHLPALSTWLGHTEPASTYWYLEASPELLALAAERMTRAGHTLQERSQ